MDKLKLAHDYFMKHVTEVTISDEQLVKGAWRYADAMQAEADSRVNKERPVMLQDSEK